MKNIIKTDECSRCNWNLLTSCKKRKYCFSFRTNTFGPKKSMQLVEGIEKQIHQVFKNLLAVVEASGGSFNDLVKLNIYLTDLNNFALVNSIMEEYFSKPFPARAAVGVASLPKDAQVEADGFLVLD